MNKIKSNLLLVFLLFGSSLSLSAQSGYTPKYHLYHILVSSSDEVDANYLAFPSLLRLNPNEILISYKRGTRHGADQEAGLEMIHFDTEQSEIINRVQLPMDNGLVHQMGEWVRFPNGVIKLYSDTQHTGHDSDNYRTGLREMDFVKKKDRFEAKPAKLSPMVDGREYGYAFDFIVQGETTYMLVMGFGYRPGEQWSVDVVESWDNGQSWKLVRNLTKEFGGHKINESAFIPYEDGYIVTTREYGINQRIYRTDKDFKVIKETNLSETHEFIESHLGRPRLFSRDGKIYLIGRNWRTTAKEGRKMELGLFAINPETLTVEKWTVLDNSDRANMTDGHYAVPYFQDRNGITYFNVIDYRGVNGEHPDIVRHEFKWDEIK